MALTREQKGTQLQEITEKMSRAQSMMFAHYIGLKVSEVNSLRSSLRKSGAEMKVAKKTLISLAAKEVGLPELPTTHLDGPVTCIFSFTDPLSGAQIALKFGKDHPQVQIIGGVFDQKILSKEEALAFAKIPGRTQLLAIFVTMLNSPLSSFVRMCNSPLSSFARALNEVAQKKASSSS